MQICMHANFCWHYSWLNILTEESVQILSTKRICVIPWVKQHTISSCMEKDKKAVNLASEFEISKQPVSNILKNEENISMEP